MNSLRHYAITMINMGGRWTTGSCSTFEFPSLVNLSGLSLYCIARTLDKSSRHSIGLASATRLTWSDFRLNLLLLKGQGCVEQNSDYTKKDLIVHDTPFLVSHSSIEYQSYCLSSRTYSRIKYKQSLKSSLGGWKG